MLRGFSRSGVLDAVGVVDEDAVVVVRVWLLFFFLFFEWLERSSLGYGSFRGTRVVFSSGGRTVELLWTSKPEKNLQHKHTDSVIRSNSTTNAVLTREANIKRKTMQEEQRR